MRLSGIVLFLGVLVLTLTGCKDKPKEMNPEPTTANTAAYYTEQYRPQYHFTPEEKWMNDPNGLVYNDGVYHLFYQYYPEDIVWGPMHWGHAVSEDMISWQHKPIALYPDEHGLIFSGSAVVDKNNTSGFGTAEVAPLVAIFTYHDMAGEKEGTLDFQTQGIAYSLDNGESWEKYEGNPVISNPGIKDFRDPKVFWHEETEKWIMILVAGDRAQFYKSDNLKKWEFMSEFGKEQGAHGGVWECPDLFSLKTDGSGKEEWVLIISINPGAPNGGSGTQYFIGDFDGETFSSDQKTPKWLDWGTDNYAGVTYNNAPGGNRIFIGWMSNWAYARDTPTEKWRSAMTVPRELSLGSFEGGTFLLNYPLKSFEKLLKSEIQKTVELAPERAERIDHNNFSQSEIRFTTKARDFKLSLGNTLNEVVVLSADSSSETFTLDRTNSGKTDFQADFANRTHQMPFKLSPQHEVEYRILVDHSSIEVFINKGQYVMTSQIFPNESYNSLDIKNTSKAAIEINNFEVFKVASVW